MSGKSKTAWAYLRVSSVGQTRRAESDEGFSLEAQRDGCARKAASHDAEIVREYVVRGQTGREENRVLRQLIHDLSEDPPDYVIVYKLDRFARDELLDFESHAKIRAAGAQLLSVLENIDESPSGMLLHAVLAGVNAFYSRDMGRRIMDGSVRKAKNGGSPIRVPLGYLNVQRIEHANDIRTVELDPERAELIQWAFSAYASGEYTLNELVKALYKKGLRTRPTKSTPPGKVSRSVLARLLSNPYYVGIVQYRGVEYEGRHPKLIPADVFEKVQQILAARHTAGEKSWRWGHYLKGTVYCGYCGSRLRFTQVKGNGGTYRYFMCGGRHEGKRCPLPYLAQEDVEESVAAYYGKQVRFSAEQIAGFEEKLLAIFKRLEAYGRREANRHRRNRDKVLGKRRKLLDAHLRGDIPPDLHREKQAELSRELLDSEQQLAKAERAVGKPERGVKLARELLRNSATAYRSVDDLTRRQWNQVFFQRLMLRPGEVVGAELSETYGGLLSEQLLRDVEKLTAQPATLRGHGSSVSRIVELGGLEPPTSWVRSRRSSS
jgi:site-specific DNA recombinase